MPLIDPAEVIADWVINTPGANGPYSIVSKPAPFTVEFIDVSQNSDFTLNKWWVNGDNATSNFMMDLLEILISIHLYRNR